MTGKFYIQKNKKRSKTSFYYKIKEREDKHNHLIFYFNKKISLIYNDVRRFGFIKIIHKNNIKNISHLKNLGPEPMSKDFNKKYFCHYIKKIKKRSIKNLLMDQKFVAGLGNIYVNEILFLSKISPLKKVSSIKNEKFSIIIKTIKKILKISIKEGGSSIKDFSSSEGEEGSFQQQFKVYGKKDENCPTPECSGLIERIVISGRATFYCKICQK